MFSWAPLIVLRSIRKYGRIKWHRVWNWLNDSAWRGAGTPVGMSMAQESLSVTCWHTQGLAVSFSLLLYMFEISHKVCGFFNSAWQGRCCQSPGLEATAAALVKDLMLGKIILFPSKIRMFKANVTKLAQHDNVLYIWHSLYKIFHIFWPCHNLGFFSLIKLGKHFGF